MNISKFKLVWTAVCGMLNPFGSMAGNVADYLLDVLNRALANLDNTKKDRIGSVVKTARSVFDILLKLQIFVPTRWRVAYVETQEAVRKVIDSLEDLNLTWDEFAGIRREFGEAVEAWKAE